MFCLKKTHQWQSNTNRLLNADESMKLESIEDQKQRVCQHAAVFVWLNGVLRWNKNNQEFEIDTMSCKSISLGTK